MQSDFYSYRYFASEGFLPGYNFPRLPLSAFIPAARGAGRARRVPVSGRGSSRSPSSGRASIVYHEGARYLINRVILPAERTEDNQLVRRRGQAVRELRLPPPDRRDGAGPDLCERCEAPLDAPMHEPVPPAERRHQAPRPDQLATRRSALRQGYEIRTGVRFAERDGRATPHRATSSSDGDDVGDARPTATPRRSGGSTSAGRRREDREPARLRARHRARLLGEERPGGRRRPGRPDEPAAASASSPSSRTAATACSSSPTEPLDPSVMASLAGRAQERDPGRVPARGQRARGRAAARRATTAACSCSTRRPRAAPACCAGSSTTRRRSPRVAREALELCHFDPDTGEDLRQRARRAGGLRGRLLRLPAELRNQRDHRAARPQADPRLLLRARATPTVEVVAGGRRREPSTSSELERAGRLRARAALARLPRRRAATRCRPHAQQLHRAVPTPGPTSSTTDHSASSSSTARPRLPRRRAARRRQAAARLEDLGYTVIRFGHDDDDWAADRRQLSRASSGGDA